MSISEISHRFRTLSTSEEKKIVLKTSDGDTFEVDESVALQSQTIAHLIEDDCAKNEVPLPNVTSQILVKVLEYCQRHVGDGGVLTEEEIADLKKWDAEFVNTDQSTIFEMILASNYLNVKSLLDLLCQTIADQIAACGSAEEIREKFQIENDFTPEEEEAVRRENQWSFE
ncbi:unnamed protein product [Arabis nemorensis]|uniref:SKP1-like protein n=1 Tax=Arabis nemorensis TaxID=586526 RepID=A0A565BFZ1_9BRAS|nr:unnamed protein product [Arabis nemorensis]